MPTTHQPIAVDMRLTPQATLTRLNGYALADGSEGVALIAHDLAWVGLANFMSLADLQKLIAAAHKRNRDLVRGG